MDDYFIPITAAEWRYLRTLAEPTCCAACGVVVKGDGIEQDVGCAYVLCGACYETAKKEADHA
jgi:hypothetical protein